MIVDKMSTNSRNYEIALVISNLLTFCLPLDVCSLYQFIFTEILLNIIFISNISWHISPS